MLNVWCFSGTAAYRNCCVDPEVNIIMWLPMQLAISASATTDGCCQMPAYAANRSFGLFPPNSMAVDCTMLLSALQARSSNSNAGCVLRTLPLVTNNDILASTLVQRGKWNKFRPASSVPSFAIRLPPIHHSFIHSFIHSLFQSERPDRCPFLTANAIRRFRRDPSSHRRTPLPPRVVGNRSGLWLTTLQRDKHSTDPQSDVRGWSACCTESCRELCQYLSKRFTQVSPRCWSTTD